MQVSATAGVLSCFTHSDGTVIYTISALSQASRQSKCRVKARCINFGEANEVPTLRPGYGVPTCHGLQIARSHQPAQLRWQPTHLQLHVLVVLVAHFSSLFIRWHRKSTVVVTRLTLVSLTVYSPASGAARDRPPRRPWLSPSVCCSMCTLMVKVLGRWSSSTCSRGRFTFSWTGGRSRVSGHCFVTMLHTSQFSASGYDPGILSSISWFISFLFRIITVIFFPPPLVLCDSVIFRSVSFGFPVFLFGGLFSAFGFCTFLHFIVGNEGNNWVHPSVDK